MDRLDIFFFQDYFAWIISGSAALLALLAGYAEHRRQNRRDINRVGFMPWMTIMVLAGVLSFAFFIYALHSGGAQVQ